MITDMICQAGPAIALSHSSCSQASVSSLVSKAEFQSRSGFRCCHTFLNSPGLLWSFCACTGGWPWLWRCASYTGPYQQWSASSFSPAAPCLRSLTLNEARLEGGCNSSADCMCVPCKTATRVCSVSRSTISKPWAGCVVPLLVPLLLCKSRQSGVLHNRRPATTQQSCIPRNSSSSSNSRSHHHHNNGAAHRAS